MTWSTVTAGGSATTWSGQTAGGSSTTWSATTAGGSATTWSGATAGGSATTWATGYSIASVLSFGWIPYGALMDLWGGADFAPKASIAAPAKSHATGSGTHRRPLAVWNPSVITSSAFTAEGMP